MLQASWIACFEVLLIMMIDDNWNMLLSSPGASLLNVRVTPGVSVLLLKSIEYQLILSVLVEYRLQVQYKE